jgi:putative NIF3 family GTP cyclohydrolase 1 type 2
VAIELCQNAPMKLTRRSVLMAGATIAAASSARVFGASDSALTAADVVERIKGKVGIPWLAETVDRIVAGDATVRVRGVATTMMATLDVVQKAAAAGKNLVITHEPTFYSHFDTTEPLQDDPTFRGKQNLIKSHDIAIFRFHDHWHRMSPDGIETGMARELGWERNADATKSRQFVFPQASLSDFAKTMAARLNARSMRVMGDPKLPIRRVAVSWGYASLMPDLIKVAADPSVDLLIVGETREWELVEYVQDQITAGAKKALIVLNHVVSEQAGMKYCAEWLKTFVTEVPIEFIPAQEPFSSVSGR